MKYIEDAYQYRLVYNGHVYRLQFQFYLKNHDSTETWPFIGDSYTIAEAYGIRCDRPLEFATRADAIAYIRKQYGERGIEKLGATWIPVPPFFD